MLSQLQKDINKVHTELDKMIPGDYKVIETSPMWKADKDYLIEICQLYIWYQRKVNNNFNYWFSMDYTIFFYEYVKPVLNA